MDICSRLLALASVALLVCGCASTEPARSHGAREAATQAPVQRFVFYTTAGSGSPAVLTLDFAVIAGEKGHEVSVFLAGDATLLMKDAVASAIRAPGQPGVAELLVRARDLGVPVYV